jgi:predicted transglutaminase-like cysteine proteinase
MAKQLQIRTSSMDVFSYAVFRALESFRKLNGLVIAFCLLVVAIVILSNAIAGPSRESRLPTMFSSEGVALGRTPFDADYRRAAVPGRGYRWAGIVSRAREIADPFERVKFIHQTVRLSVIYTDDKSLYSMDDYWASPTETLSRGRGDCEDFAILEMMLLQAVGFNASDTYLTIGFDQLARRDHALLSVNINNVMWTLDQRAPAPLPTATVMDFRPIMTLSARNAWLHGYRISTGDSQFLSGPLSTVLGLPTPFEKRIDTYYSETFWMNNFFKIIGWIFILWTILKIVFYVLPVYGLIKIRKKQINILTGEKVHLKKYLSKIIILLMFIFPVIDVFAYFYIVTNIVGRIKVRNIYLIIRCQLYGIAAGVMALFWSEELFNFTLMSGGYIMTGQIGFHLYNSSVVFATWFLLSINHVHHIYLLHQEIDHSIATRADTLASWTPKSTG